MDKNWMFHYRTEDRDIESSSSEEELDWNFSAISSCSNDETCSSKNFVELKTRKRQMEEMIKERNELMHPEVRLRLKDEWPEMKNTVDLSKIGSGQQVDYKEIHDEQREIIKRCAMRCFYDTRKNVLDKIANLSEKHFDYLEFQRGLKLQKEEDELTHLEKNVGLDDPEYLELPERKEITAKFQKMYGPIDKKNRVAITYLKSYMESKRETIEYTNEKQLFFEKAAEVHGLEFVRQCLKQEREELDEERSTLSQDVEMKSQIYDMNPYTNPTHSEWFLLPRPPIPNESNLFIRQLPLEEKLVEYQVPEHYFQVSGYWPNLTDFNMVKAKSSQLVIPKDPIEYTRRFFNPAENKMTPEEREMFWIGLSVRIMNSIQNYPCGIDLKSFFANLLPKLESGEKCDFFPGLSEETAVTQFMSDFILSTKISRGVKDKSVIILYPPYLGGVVDEEMLMEITQRIWLRISYLVRTNKDRTVWLTLLERMYRHWFGTSDIWKRWGFKSTAKFVEWCISKWSPEGNYKTQKGEYHFVAALSYTDKP